MNDKSEIHGEDHDNNHDVNDNCHNQQNNDMEICLDDPSNDQNKEINSFETVQLGDLSQLIDPKNKENFS